MAADDPDSSRIQAAVDEVIVECGGDARAAIAELIVILQSVVAENRALRAAASPGSAGRRRVGFEKSN
jgi:hypothetical protein